MNAPEATTGGHHDDRMRRRPREPFTLVVMEDGSEWPASVPGKATERVTLKQDRHEVHGCLLLRAMDRVRKIEASGGVVEQVVLCCSGDASDPAVQGRATVARALLERVLRGADAGRLELVALQGASATVKQSLVALAGSLSQALAGTHASVGARFPESDPACAASRARGPHRMERRHAA